MTSIETAVKYYEDGVSTLGDLMADAVNALATESVEHVVLAMPAEHREEFVAWLRTLTMESQNLMEGGYHNYAEGALAKVLAWQTHGFRPEGGWPVEGWCSELRVRWHDHKGPLLVALRLGLEFNRLSMTTGVVRPWNRSPVGEPLIYAHGDLWCLPCEDEDPRALRAVAEVMDEARFKREAESCLRDMMTAAWKAAQR